MVFKPNYNMQKNERTRAKQAKKDEKLRAKEEDAARRKAELEANPDAPPSESAASESPDAA